MKILHVINAMSMGGAQSLLVDLIPAQMKLGHQVHLLQLGSPKDNTLLKKIEDKGVTVSTLNPNGSLYNPLLALKLGPFMEGVDIIHVHLFPALYWVAFGKLWCRSKAKLVYTEHNTTNKRRNKPIFSKIDQFIYKKYNLVVACSEKVKDKFEECFPGIPCYAISNGIDVRKYSDAHSYSKRQFIDADEDVFVATMVARFRYPKRQDVLINAIAKLPDKFHVVLVGGEDGSAEVERCKEIAKARGVSSRVHFLGLRSDVPEILKSSDVIVMSSEYEGLSLSSLEGMSSGKPFVASDSNGLREVVAGAGVLFKCNDIDELAGILQRFSVDEEYYKDVIRKCQSKAMQFDINRVAERYIEQYQKQLE